jgi:Zn-dependent peptidase ImmA (M78 family)
MVIAEKAIASIECKEAPIPIEKIAEKFGLKVIDFDFPDSIPGVLKADKGVIGVNKNNPKVRRRFTVAHELGHFLLEHALRKETDIIDEGSNQHVLEEREANSFASQILMPEEMVRKEVGSKTINLKELASKFDVSEQAITIRLLMLNLIK